VFTRYSQNKKTLFIGGSSNMRIIKTTRYSPWQPPRVIKQEKRPDLPVKNHVKSTVLRDLSRPDNRYTK
jgi:hypothetical protein